MKNYLRLFLTLGLFALFTLHSASAQGHPNRKAETPSIVFSTHKTIGQTVKLKIKANGKFSVIGASNQGTPDVYELTAQEISIFGDITEFECSQNKIHSLSLLSASVLKTLLCDDNELTILKLNKAESLQELNCNKNLLQSIDLSGVSALSILSCSKNKLSTIEPYLCPNLKELNCTDNKLTLLDLKKNNALNILSCSNNLIADIYLPAEGSLKHIDCLRNKLREFGMEKFLESLPVYKAYPTDQWNDYEGYLPQGIYLIDPTNAEQNIATKANIAIAKAKGWPVWSIDYEKIGDEKPKAFDGAEKLVKVTFEVPSVGVKSHKVSMEASGEEPERVFKADADGITYHLPNGQEIWFELEPDEKAGYFVSHWLQDGSQVAYSSRMNSRAIKAYNGLNLKVELEREGTTYIVKFDQPEGAVLVCKNRNVNPGENDAIRSGDKVPAADNILFEVSPTENPNGTVNVKHWEINGRIYEDVVGDPITSNSIEFKLLHDVEVKVVLAEPDNVCGMTNSDSKIFYSPTDRTIYINHNAAKKAEVYTMSGIRVTQEPIINGTAKVDMSAIQNGLYIVKVGSFVSKISVF